MGIVFVCSNTGIGCGAWDLCCVKVRNIGEEGFRDSVTGVECRL